MNSKPETNIQEEKEEDTSMIKLEDLEEVCHLGSGS